MQTTKQPGGTRLQQTTLDFAIPIETWAVAPLINLVETIAGRHGLESCYEIVHSLEIVFEHVIDGVDLEAFRQELEQHRIYCAWKTE